MFAALIIEREPLGWSDIPAGVIQWFQAVGGFCALGLILWFLLALPRMRPQDRAAIPGWMVNVFVGSSILSWLLYIAFFVTVLAGMGQLDPTGRPTRGLIAQIVIHTAAGFFATVAAGLPFVRSLFRFRLRRIYALAKLSFMEALRRKVLYAFSGLLLVFLFASWFVPAKPEDQVRTYVKVVFFAISYLFLFTAALMSSFSIPADIKLQTIHTIVTKPVERFELVLGRFLGFLALMTLVLVGLTTASLLLVVFTNIHPDAADESLKAREPAYGDLRFENTENERSAINVGREWEYRSYITRTANLNPQTARWDFASVSASRLGASKQVRCEYTFDIYRTTKGSEGRPVTCVFRFYTNAYKPGNDLAFRSGREGATPEAIDKLAEDLGFYEALSCPVVDYHTLAFNVPGGLFRSITSTGERDENGQVRLPLQVRVVSDDATQYVGMAKYDFYIRLDEDSRWDRAWFTLNFYKAAFGLWLEVALVIGLSVIFSTYLTGVVSFLFTGMLYVGGMCREFIETVAIGQNYGGGPGESLVRLMSRDLSGPSMRESQAAGERFVYGSDEIFRFIVKRILNLIPDISRYDFTTYAAEGFNVPGRELVLSTLLLFAYLLPWAVLSYYLIRWREIANPQ